MAKGAIAPFCLWVFPASIHPSAWMLLEPTPAAMERRRGYILDKLAIHRMRRDNRPHSHSHTREGADLSWLPWTQGDGGVAPCPLANSGFQLARVPRENAGGSNLQPSCSEATVPTTAPRCHLSNNTVQLIAIHILRAAAPLLRHTSTATQLMDESEALICTVTREASFFRDASAASAELCRGAGPPSFNCRRGRAHLGSPAIPLCG